MSAPCGYVLDLGCGRYGTQLSLQRELLGTSGVVIGLDLDFGTLASVRRSNPDARVCAALGEQLPFCSQVFDRVMCLDVFEHVVSEKELLNEIRRVIRPEGVLVLSVPHQGLFECLDVLNIKVAFPKAYAVLNRLLGRKGFYANQLQQQIGANIPVANRTNPALYHRHYSLHAIMQLLGDGWSLVEVRRTSLLIFPVVSLIAGVMNLFSERSVSWLWKLAALEDHVDFGHYSYNMILAVQHTLP